MTVKVRAAVKLGEPSSVTRTVIRLVLGPCASLGVQVKIPLVGLMTAPAGALLRLKVRICAGASMSDAALVKASVAPSSIT